MSEYSGLELSRTSDRLPAIAGLAREFQEVESEGVRPVYLAGLWKDSLINDLLWRVTKPLKGRCEDRPRDHHPPTWSWASVNGRVSYWPEGFYDKGFEILSAETSSAAYTDCFGESTGGRITVIGHIRPATLFHNRVVASNSSSKLESWQFSLAIMGKIIKMFADYCLANPGPGCVGDHDEVFCLGNFISSSLRASLVVRKCVTEEGVIGYERIGIVQLPREPNNSKGTPSIVSIEGTWNDPMEHVTITML